MSEQLAPRTRFSLVIVDTRGKISTTTCYSVSEIYKTVENHLQPVFSFSVYACSLEQDEPVKEEMEVINE